jgi:hypothetical protein
MHDFVSPKRAGNLKARTSLETVDEDAAAATQLQGRVVRADVLRTGPWMFNRRLNTVALRTGIYWDQEVGCGIEPPQPDAVSPKRRRTIPVARCIHLAVTLGFDN